MEKLMTAKDVMEMLQISTTAFWRIRKNGDFPAPSININRKLQRWSEQDVQAYMRGESKMPKTEDIVAN